MVKIKALGKELTHLTRFTVGNAQIAVGVLSATQTTEFVLFEKEDVLINKIEKLPVMTSLKLCSEFPTASIGEDMAASALEVINYSIRVYNANAANISTENLIYQNDVITYIPVANAFTFVQSDTNEEEFCELLTDTITIVVQAIGNDAAGGANFPANYFLAQLLSEINWVKVTEEELKQYALEHLYVNM